ncbi:DUF975 family protein [Paenibacillus aestuarii]|uniref:DUF975 family protein n=1 Tax=Paenibacillus aestuarii TaxID=516965 RepID=A0ABW0K8Q5_9BACL|nr:DUF975 family protein [Paenibacillus aestuarii]
MWTRKELKDRAKQVLKTSYWKAFLVGLLLAFVSGGLPGSFNGNFGGHTGSHNGVSMPLPGMGHGGEDTFSGAFLIFLLIAILFGILALLSVLAFRVFLGAPLEVGATQYYKQAAQSDVNMNYLGFAFSKGKYGAIVKAMFWRWLLNFLWTLLLIIPGIVKSYAYSMVPFILGDNPNVGTKRAVELSNRMTRGHKWKMFVLDLSFLGWYLLGVIALFIGVLFVLPYYYSTKAELYLVLRQQALYDGLTSESELNMAESV